MILLTEVRSEERRVGKEWFKARLVDRFGPVPKETEELLRIVALRRLGARIGVERIFLKAGNMTLFFIADNDSPYFQSEMFGRVINYMMRYTKRCDLREKKGKRSMVIKQIPSVEEAITILQEIVATPAD